MSKQVSLDPARTAVLCMDYQSFIVSTYAGDGGEELLARAAGVLKRARESGMTVIYVRVGFRPNMPEVSPRNMMFDSIRSSAERRQRFQGESGEIHPAVAPEADDIVVTKHRVNAFAGTDLEMILRAKDVDTLVMFGIATSGVVLSTLLDASDADYCLFVIEDCCADTDEQVHACLFGKLFPRRAVILSADEFHAASGPTRASAEE
jgi:nicotinamidase-related amidase